MPDSARSVTESGLSLHQVWLPFEPFHRHRVTFPCESLLKGAMLRFFFLPEPVGPAERFGNRGPAGQIFLGVRIPLARRSEPVRGGNEIAAQDFQQDAAPNVDCGRLVV